MPSADFKRSIVLRDIELFERDPEFVLDLDTLSFFSRNEAATGSVNPVVLEVGADLEVLLGISSSSCRGDGSFDSGVNGAALGRLFTESDLGRCGGIGATRLGTGGIEVFSAFGTGERVPLEEKFAVSGVETGEASVGDGFLVLIRKSLFDDFTVWF